jgi:hypothetical protein
MKTVKVDQHLITLLKCAAEEELSDPLVRKLWLDQCTSSRASQREGGVVALRTDHDWAVAFFILRYGSLEINSRVVRE